MATEATHGAAAHRLARLESPHAEKATTIDRDPLWSLFDQKQTAALPQT